LKFIPVRTPFFIRRFYSNYTWKKPTNKKVIYLTFDDGPTPEITTWVLDQLKKHQAKATFFCIGSNIEKHPEIFKAIQLQGHVIANHTQNHIKGWQHSVETYLNDVELTQEHIKNFSINSIENSSEEKNKKLFRPPHGQIKKSQGKALIKNGYEIIMWSILTFDWDNNITKNSCLRNAFKANSGDIVVFHDSIKASKNMQYVLPIFLEYYKEKGFSFEVLN